MHRIDGVDVETEELQGEDRALVAYVPAHDVGLNAAGNNHTRRNETRGEINYELMPAFAE